MIFLLSTSGLQGVRTQAHFCFGHLRVGVPCCSFCFWLPFAFLSPLFDASSHRATRLSGLLLSLSCFSVSVFVIAATLFARNVPHPSGSDGALGPSGLPGSLVRGHLGHASAWPPVAGGGGALLSTKLKQVTRTFF